MRNGDSSHEQCARIAKLTSRKLKESGCHPLTWPTARNLT